MSNEIQPSSDAILAAPGPDAPGLTAGTEPTRAWVRWAPLAVAIATPTLLFFVCPPLTRSGLWDPFELNVADLARRIALNLYHASHLALEGADNSLPHLNDSAVRNSPCRRLPSASSSLDCTSGRGVCPSHFGVSPASSRPTRSSRACSIDALEPMPRSCSRPCRSTSSKRARCSAKFAPWLVLRWRSAGLP